MSILLNCLWYTPPSLQNVGCAGKISRFFSCIRSMEGRWSRSRMFTSQKVLLTYALAICSRRPPCLAPSRPSKTALFLPMHLTKLPDFPITTALDVTDHEGPTVTGMAGVLITIRELSFFLCCRSQVLKFNRYRDGTRSPTTQGTGKWRKPSTLQ